MGSRHAVVIGAGIGGLSAAIHLAAQGLRVTVLESSGEPGGKAGTATIDGVAFDTGPSVLTMPDVFDDLLKLAGMSLGEHIDLVSPSPSFRYLWPDGASLDTFVSKEETLASVCTAFGSAAEDELAGFLSYAANIWEVASPRFVRGPAPNVWSFLSLSALRELPFIDPLRTMRSAIDAKVREPHLRDVLLRYATYVGSDPRRAPATLGCIAHVELSLGGYGVRGGISALVSALVEATQRLDVVLRLNEPVRSVIVSDRCARGVITERGHVQADLVVSNAEVSHLYGVLCQGQGLRCPPPSSTSGINAVVRAKIAPRAAHTVLFPARYEQEFVDLFDHARTPRDPTLYVCAQRVAHDRQVWPDTEPLFVMVNAPCLARDAAEEESFDTSHSEENDVEKIMMDRMCRVSLLSEEDAIIWRRDPRGLALRFPGSRGALYGPASNGSFSPLQRAGNRVPGVAGLYVASGSAHPGGGLPLAALSGRAAAIAALEDSP